MWGWGGESLEQLRAPGEGRLWGTQMRGVVSFSESEAFSGICPAVLCGSENPVLLKAQTEPGWRGHLKSLWRQLQLD